MLTSENISFVLQGPVIGPEGHFFETAEVVRHLKRLSPNSEIIVSTWEGSNIDSIPADKVILSPLPKAYLFGEERGKLNNLNRMLLSTQAGIEAATRKYIYKIRTDLVPRSLSALPYWEMLATKPTMWPLFSRQILAYPIYSLLWDGEGQHMPRPFHVSDWAYFGLTQDIKKLFDIPLAKEPEFSEYFNVERRTSKKHDNFPNHLWRMSPEQYIFSTCFTKSYPRIKFQDKRDYDSSIIEISRAATFHNFVFIDGDMWDLHSGKADYQRDIKQYDENCFWGLIHYGVCMRARQELGIPTPQSALIEGGVRLRDLYRAKRPDTPYEAYTNWPRE